MWKTPFPAHPQAYPVTTTRTTAILTWTAPTDDGGTPITEYQYRFIAGSTAGGAWTDTNSTAVTFTISSLDPSTEYTFQVRAVNSVGNSDASSAVTESTLTTVPGAPTGLSATAQTGGTSVELDWTAPTNNGGSTIIDYEVSSDDGGTWNSTGSATTSYTVTGLDKGTEYIFRVRAVNSPHGDGDASASVTETTLTTVPASPTKSDCLRYSNNRRLIMDSPNRYRRHGDYRISIPLYNRNHSRRHMDGYRFNGSVYHDFKSYCRYGIHVSKSVPLIVLATPLRVML